MAIFEVGASPRLILRCRLAAEPARTVAVSGELIGLGVCRDAIVPGGIVGGAINCSHPVDRTSADDEHTMFVIMGVTWGNAEWGAQGRVTTASVRAG
jgi:hypothetical protein